jgi:hypothetical protein
MNEQCRGDNTTRSNHVVGVALLSCMILISGQGRALERNIQAGRCECPLVDSWLVQLLSIEIFEIFKSLCPLRYK